MSLLLFISEITLHKFFYSTYIDMFSKDLVKLTGVFLFYISATSATPTTGQPEEAHNVNDDIHARTDNPYQCQPPYIWLRRECVASSSPMA